MSEFLYNSDKDLYSLLFFTSEATLADKKKAYYYLVLQYYSDKHTNSTPEQYEKETQKFHKLEFEIIEA
ncbi:hypothetical protein C2G38_2228742 [Gigaspora rosea]|uniref:J domain-containing protein n=1 Tax=Gigaspora rosea TaxID=44941 RepID=A0A397TYU6_9GLOM|nr:hypothetical protein C2G38_2228742 [Gigaspora rosea]